jgi:antitoxin component YwqK of YwqJK toxin-antitoxin module
MKLFLTSLTLIFCLQVTFAQDDWNKTNAKGEKHGPWKEFYENSKIPRYEGQYENGKPVGTFKYYYPNKVIKAVMVFDKNPDISRCTMYDENGKKNAFGKYIKKEKDSVWTYYSPPGFISSKETYKMGKLNGEKSIYFPPANERSTAQQASQAFNYVNDLLSGTFKEFYPDGTLKTEGQYVNDKMHGEVKKYHPNGKLFFLERYKNGVRHGWWYTYNETGKETARTYFHNGQELKGKLLKRHMEKLKAQGIDPNK